MLERREGEFDGGCYRAMLRLSSTSKYKKKLAWGKRGRERSRKKEKKTKRKRCNSLGGER